MEVAFGQEAYGKHFDSFMRHYLTVKTGEIPKVRKVYEAFKDYARTPEVEAAGVDALVADIHAFAGYYCAMALGQEPDPQARRGLSRPAGTQGGRRLSVPAGALPRLRRGLLTAAETEHDCAAGRELCVPPRRLRHPDELAQQDLRHLWQRSAKDRYLESIQAHFLLLPSYRRFPSDEEFRRELKVRDLYNFRSRSYWLRRLENHGAKSGCRSTSTPSSTSCRRTRTFPPSGGRPWDPTGRRCRRPGCTRSAT